MPSSADLQVPQSGTSTVPGAGSPRPGPAESKVLVIVDENHTQAQAQADMPFLVSMQDAFGVATNYTSQAHPSLPNYLTIAGGSTFGVTNDAGPGSHPVTGPSVFGAALTQGRSARTYNEAMTGNCELASHGDYAVKHNPWAYFADEQRRLPDGRRPADDASRGHRRRGPAHRRHDHAGHVPRRAQLPVEGGG